MVDVSIVIVNWNAKNHLINCLESLKSSTHQLSQEVIVVDNNSTDGSPELVKERFPEVHLIQTGNNLGFAKGNNIGIRQSIGRYICCINSDVIVKPNCISNMMDFMDRHQDIGIAGPLHFNPNGKFLSSCKRYPSLWRDFFRAIGLQKLFPNSKWLAGSYMPILATDKAYDVDVLVGHFWMIRRKALDAVGLLDEIFFMYGEDNDWCKRFFESGWRVVFYTGAEAIHVGGASSSNDPTRFSIELRKSNLIFWEKHKGIFGRHCSAIILFLRLSMRILAGVFIYIIDSSRRKGIMTEINRRIACIRWLLHL